MCIVKACISLITNSVLPQNAGLILQIHGMKKQTLLFYSLTTLFVLLSGIYALLYTTAGFTWYLNRYLGDSNSRITIDKLSHTVNGKYTIAGLKYVTPRYQLEITKLELAWSPLKILDHEIDIQSFAGESIAIHWAGELQQPRLPVTYQLPFTVKINSGSIRNLSLNISDALSESFHHVKFEQVYLFDNFFTNKMIFTTANGGAFEISGKAGFRPTDVINLTTKATFAIPNTSKVISSQGTIVGTPVMLKFLQQIKAPYASRFAGSITNLLVDPKIDFDLELRSVSGEAISPIYKVSMLKGELTGQGSLSSLNVNGSLELKDEHARWWRLLVDSSLGEGKADFHIKSSQDAHNKIDLRGEWEYQSARSWPRTVSVNGSVENLSWPLNDTSLINVRKGNFQYDGNTLQSVVDFRHLNVESTGTQITSLELQTHSDEKQRVILSGKAATSNGSLRFTGELDKQLLGYRLANLSLTGNNFALVRKPKAHIMISPDLTFSSQNDRSIQSRGVIKVPTANIQLQGISETYNQLAGLFFSHKKINTATAQSIKQLNVEFGKSVWLHGYGLNANVTGELAIENLSSKKLIANGNLNVLRGNYTNHDRKFMVSGGLLKFKNKQLDNPELELKVVEKQVDHSKPELIKGPLQTLHTAQDRAPKDLSSQSTKRIALNN